MRPIDCPHCRRPTHYCTCSPRPDTRLIDVNPDRCREAVRGPDGLARPARGRCDRPAERLSVDVRHLGRGIVSECYCELHGGIGRALSYLSLNWDVTAPASVGDGQAVDLAGAAALTSREAYVVIRPETHERTVWLAWLGLGGHLQQVPNPHGGKLTRDGRIATRKGPGGRRVPRGGKSFASRDEALSAAVTAWRRNLRDRVDTITRERGGTLAWGVPIYPRSAPVVIELGEHGSAWDEVRP